MASRFVLPFADVGSGIKPSDGAKLTFKNPGLETLKDTFSDSTGLTENTNPVVSDANGLFSNIYIKGSYDVVLQDKNNVQIWADSVSEFATSAETAARFLFRPEPSGYTTDILTSLESPGVFESDFRDSNEAQGSGAKWLKTGNTGTAGTDDIDLIYNGNGDEYKILTASPSVRQCGALGLEATFSSSFTYKTTLINVDQWSHNQDIKAIFIRLVNNYPEVIIDEGVFWLDGLTTVTTNGCIIRGMGSGKSMLIGGSINPDANSHYIRVTDLGFGGQYRPFTPPLPITIDPLLEFDNGFIWFLDFAQLGYDAPGVGINSALALGVVATNISVDNCYFEMRESCMLATSALEDRPDTVKQLRFTDNTTNSIWFHGFGGRYNRGVVVSNNIMFNHWAGMGCDSSSGCEQVTFDGNVLVGVPTGFKSESRTSDASINQQSSFTDNIIISPEEGDPHADTYMSRVTGRGTKVTGNLFLNRRVSIAHFMQCAATYNDISDNTFINAGVGEMAGVIELFSDVFIQQNVGNARIYGNRYVKAIGATGAVVNAFLDITERGVAFSSDFGDVRVHDNDIDECLNVVLGNNTTTANESANAIRITGNRVGFCYRMYAGSMVIGTLEVSGNTGYMSANGVLAESNAYVDVQLSRITTELAVIDNTFLFSNTFTPSPSLPTKLLEVGGGLVDLSGSKLRVLRNNVEISEGFVFCQPTNASQYPDEITVSYNNIEQRSTSSGSTQITVGNRPTGTATQIVTYNTINAIADDFFILADNPAGGLSIRSGNVGLGTITEP